MFQTVPEKSIFQGYLFVATLRRISAFILLIFSTAVSLHAQHFSASLAEAVIATSESELQIVDPHGSLSRTISSGLSHRKNQDTLYADGLSARRNNLQLTKKNSAINAMHCSFEK